MYERFLREMDITSSHENIPYTIYTVIFKISGVLKEIVKYIIKILYFMNMFMLWIYLMDIVSQSTTNKYFMMFQD